MAKYTFATLDQWVSKSKARMDAVVQGSAERVVSEAQKPRSEGGKMPVDTGFLRASLQSSLEGGAVIKGAESHVLIAGQMEAGDTAHFGWTAEYARRVNSGFTGPDSLGRVYNQQGAHFLEYGALQWESIVRQETVKAKAAVNG